MREPSTFQRAALGLWIVAAIALGCHIASGCHSERWSAERCAKHCGDRRAYYGHSAHGGVCLCEVAR